MPDELAEAIFARSPHAAFDRISAMGYVLGHHFPDGPDAVLAGLVVRALLGAARVAEADFSGDGFAAHCQNVRVDEAHRRRGLATAMYLLAERVCGKPLRDYWKGDRMQSAAARAMWANPDRPFGRTADRDA